MRDHPLPRQLSCSGVCNYLSTPWQLGNKDVLLGLLFLFSLTFGLIKEEKELRNQQTATQTVLLTGTLLSKKSELPVRHTDKIRKSRENLPFPPAFEKRYTISYT